MFTIISGKPGSSKTSHIIDHVHFSGQYKDRPVYYRGIKGLQLPWFELSDEEAAVWPEHVVDGAVVIIDEAQEIWPVRPPSKAVPPGLVALEKHRHRGIDIFFLSQDPSLLDNHARKICNEHKHYSRPFGAPFAIEYHAGSGYVSPENKSALATCIQTKKALPKRVWGLYHSAEVHTHKFRPPKMLFIIPLLFVGVIFLVWKFLSSYGDQTQPIADQAPVHQAESNRLGLRSTVQDTRVDMTWPELLTPEIPDLPWTAPLYRERAMRVDDVPRVAACIQAKSIGCQCYTQQGTLLAGISERMCINHVRHGYFDHMLEPKGRRESTIEQT